MTTPPPRPYSEAHLKNLYSTLPETSYLAELIKTSLYDNRTLFNALKKQSHSRKFNSHTKNRIRSIRTVIYQINLNETPLWLSETDPDIKAVIHWRLSLVG